MGSKNSIKSKSQHLAHVETLMLHETPVEWQGNGIYNFNRTALTYQKVADMKDLEYRMVSDNWLPPTYIRKNQFNELINWS